MEIKNKRKNKLIGSSSIQKKTLILVFIATTLPVAVVGACLYYLIFNMLASQLGIPEIIAYNLLPVARKINLIILIALPFTLSIIWLMALELSHRIAGPIYRLEKELDDRIAGKGSGLIKLRKNDEFKLLVEKINTLISK